MSPHPACAVPQPAKSAPAELVHTKSMLRRAQNRADDLRRMFQLPSTEVGFCRCCCCHCWHAGTATKGCRHPAGSVPTAMHCRCPTAPTPCPPHRAPAPCASPLPPCLQHLIDDFMCALRKKVLLQGRMYLFREHVCFHCNLFGYQKTKCIPLAGVVEVRKKKNVGFPNSIELTLESGKREFFTSFLAREEAYRWVGGGAV